MRLLGRRLVEPCWLHRERALVGGRTPHSHRAATRTPTHESRQKKRKKKGGSAAYWSDLQGWKAVEVGDDLLLGAEEGGFGGLEVLDDASLVDAGECCARENKCPAAGRRCCLNRPLPRHTQ